MKPQIFLTALVGLTSILVSAAPGLTETRYERRLPLAVSGGKCPSYVRLFAKPDRSEGGISWTIVANIGSVARPAKLVSRNQKSVVFRAPLERAYKSCRGIASTNNRDRDLYRFRFQNGQVTFRTTLPKDTRNNSSTIRQSGVREGIPFIKWSFVN